MPILYTSFLLLAGSVVLAGLRAFRPRFRFAWWIAVSVGALALLSVLLWWPQVPVSLEIHLWPALDAIGASASFSAEDLRWPCVLGIVGLALAALLATPGRPDSPNSTGWILTLGLAGLGVLAVTADNPLTLAMLWACLDLSELGVRLGLGEERATNHDTVRAFSIRLGGTALMLLALVLGGSTGHMTGLAATPAPAGILLLAAAEIRLWVFAAPFATSEAPPLTSDVEVIMELVAAAASLGVLSRLPPGSLVSPLAPILLLLCAATAVYSGWQWLRAPDRAAGRHFWILGLSNLAVASALRGNPMGATAWDLCLMLAGGALFLCSMQQARLNRSVLVGAWAASALPLSLTATAWTETVGGLDWMLPVFLAAQALLVAGFVHHAMRSALGSASNSRSLWPPSTQPAAIGLLLVLQILLALWGWNGALQAGAAAAGLAVSAFALGLAWGRPRAAVLNPVPEKWLTPTPERAAVRLGQGIARLHGEAARAADAIARLLEGEAGIMWSVLLLALFISLIVARSP